MESYLAVIKKKTNVNTYNIGKFQAYYFERKYMQRNLVCDYISIKSPQIGKANLL